MILPDSKLDLYEQYRQEMKKIISETNKKTQAMFKELKVQTEKPKMKY